MVFYGNFISLQAFFYYITFLFFIIFILSVFLFHDYFILGDFMNIKILDTTLRDGEQTPGVSLTPLEKLRIATKLHEADSTLGGVPRPEGRARRGRDESHLQGRVHHAFDRACTVYVLR